MSYFFFFLHFRILNSFVPSTIYFFKTRATLMLVFMADREQAAVKTQLIQDPLFLISSLLLIGRVDLIIRGRCLRTGGEV